VSNDQHPQKSLLVMLCTYDEKDNLQNLISSVLEYAPDANVLVVDDNSPDGTGKIADRIAAHHDAGANHVCIQPLKPDGSPGPDERALEALAPAAQ
jgi:cellulose synthase/poly-beta-1,6-N-acetylglucosamine synthase-like glycosyltransferase